MVQVCAEDPWLARHPVQVTRWRGQVAPGEARAPDEPVPEQEVVDVTRTLVLLLDGCGVG